MFGVHTIAGPRPRPPRTALAIRDDDGKWDDWDYTAPLANDAELFESSPNDFFFIFKLFLIIS